MKTNHHTGELLVKSVFLLLFLFPFQILAQTNYFEPQSSIYDQNGGLFDHFGYAVAIDNDIAVVGVPQNDENGTNAGIVLVYQFSNNTWQQIAKLKASNGFASDEFGSSVAIYQDQIVVGAYGHDNNGADAGAAYLFVKPASGWTNNIETAELTASDAATGDNFGYSVAIGENQVVVGAYGNDDGGDYAGSGYVFDKPTTGWQDATETKKLTASDAADSDRFGMTVATSGNYIAISAILDDDNGNNSGSVYLYEKSETGWSTTENYKIQASDGDYFDRFGNAITMNDQYLVIASTLDDDNGTNSGSVYVFEKTETSWNEVAKLLAWDGNSDDAFGISISISNNQIAVGAPQDDDSGTSSGAVYLYQKPIDGWTNMTENVKLVATDAYAEDRFGFAVAVSNQYTIIGADGSDIQSENAGTAYILKTPILQLSDLPKSLYLSEQDLELHWKSYNIINTFVLEYSTDNGNSWTTFAAELTSNTTSYVWTLPSENGEYLIRAADPTSNQILSENSSFQIGSLSVNQPNGTENLEAGEVYEINWLGWVTGTVNLFYSTDDGANYTQITETNSSTNLYSWTIPELQSESCRIKIEANDNLNIKDESDQTFIINQNQAPIIINSIDNQTYAIGFDYVSIDLSQVFYDEDSDPLSYTAESANTGVAVVNIVNNMLIVGENGLGVTSISVNADDGHGHTINEYFLVTINTTSSASELQANNSIQVFPNPSNGIFYVHNELAEKSNFRIFNSSGMLVLQKYGTGKTNKLNLLDAKSGVYFLEMKTNNYTHRIQLIKK